MAVEILMSVMNQTNFDIAYKSKVNSDILIVNQCDRNAYDEIIVNGHRWRMISTKERGLSKSRNMALNNAIGDICILSDDDEVFEDGYAEMVSDAFQENPIASVIAFNVRRINYLMNKKYYTIKHFKESSRSFGSVMIGFRLDSIKNADIRFNEKFGSGSQWGGGEDTLFLRDIRKKNLKVFECPYYLATIDYSGVSQWFHGYDERYFYNLGAFLGYTNDGHVNIRLLAYSFYVCFWKLRFEKGLSFLSKFRWLYKGFKGIQRDVTYNEFLEGRK